MKKILLPILILLSLGLQAQPNVVYCVRPSGSGIYINPGTPLWAAAGGLDTTMKVVKPGDAIWMLGGTYTPKEPLVLPPSVGMYGGFTGDGITKNLAKRSIIDAQKNYGPIVVLNKHRVLDGFVIQNGLRTGKEKNGGGIWAGDSVVIENCKILNNLAYNGGGVYGKGRVRIINCEVHDNEARAYGADMYGHCLSLATVPFTTLVPPVPSEPPVLCPIPSITAQPSSARYSVVLPN